MRAIVTGGAGFIGSHLVDALVARGDEVHVVDDLSSGRRENVAAGAELHELDIRSSLREVFADVRPEVVFHLAAHVDAIASLERPEEDAAVNVGGTVNVLAAAGDAKVVFASSGGAIYGECARPAREDDPPRPVTPYGAAKLAAEGHLAASHASCRLANVYGPRQRAELEGGVVAIFLDRLRDGREAAIFGDGGQTRDFVFVADVVEALLAAAAVADGGVWNVSSGIPTSILELHRLCAAAIGLEGQPSFAAERPGDIRHSVLDASRAKRELGWRAETSLEAGLAATWDWMRSR